jgi:large subunit ribosomal protein L6
MSRLGKLPVNVPDKVIVTLSSNNIKVKGPKGELTLDFSTQIDVKLNDKKVIVTPLSKSKEANALWGTTRVLINNMITGVTSGFTKTLEFNGVGYKAMVTGSKLTLNLGFSHPIDFTLPVGVSAKVDKNIISLESASKELLGFSASSIRALRPPEPYKGKGIKYVNETIIRKAGKSGAKK